MKISQSRTDQFVAYVSARRRFPRRTALLACGDWHLAENLVQTALVKLYRAWPRIRGEVAEDVYARRVIVRAFLDETRRPCTEHDVPGTDKTVRVADPDPETNLRFGVMYQRPDGSFTAVGVYDRFGNNSVEPVVGVDITLEQAIAYLDRPFPARRSGRGGRGGRAAGRRDIRNRSRSAPTGLLGHLTSRRRRPQRT